MDFTLIGVVVVFVAIVLGVSAYKKKKKAARLTQEDRSESGGLAPDKGDIKADVVENIK